MRALAQLQRYDDCVRFKGRRYRLYPLRHHVLQNDSQNCEYAQEEEYVWSILDRLFNTLPRRSQHLINGVLAPPAQSPT